MLPIATLLILLAAPAATTHTTMHATHAGSAAHSTPAVHPADPAKLTQAEIDTLTAHDLKDRADTDEWLKSSPTSYLATVQRRDFGERTTLIIGRDAASDVRIDDPEIAARHASVTVVGDSLTVRALDDTAHFMAGANRVREATIAPGPIRIGRFTLRLSHQRFPAVIVFDPKSPGYARYHGFKWFPLDFNYRYELPLTVNAKPDTVIILSTRGNQRRALRVGWFDFRVHGVACRLEASRLLEPGVGENDFGVFFRDSTSARESYALGRYVDVEKKAGTDLYVLDFNQCYNPACSVSDHYNCPIPPRSNKLAVAIRAGEMDSHYH
jgi:uncharacterized protein